jgi:P pilus assembly chaperone PapD
MKLRRIAVSTAFLCIYSFQSVHAGYSMTPLITILEPSNKKMSDVVILKYEGDVKSPVAIELKVMGREISVDGKVVYNKDDKSINNLVVYPAQVVLMPGDVQRVQIKWVGDTVPAREVAYGLIAAQAPVKLGDEDKERSTAQGRINILTRYEGIIVVRPKNARPSTSVQAAGPKADEKGKTLLIITLKNSGTGLQKLQGMKLQLMPASKPGQSQSAGSYLYKPELTNEQSKHSIFAGFSRTLELPWPPQVPVGPVQATVSFDEAK